MELQRAVPSPPVVAAAGPAQVEVVVVPALGERLAMVESMRSTGDGFVFYKLSVGDVRS